MHIAIYFIIFIFPLSFISGADHKVCLNMIVKNESAVITRCLESVKPIIDYWVIVDTGSTDGTQKIIKEYMKDLPGELYEKPWKNFEHNRNEALEFAKGKSDYILFIDADEVLAYEPDFKLPPLKENFYFITTNFNGTKYSRVQLIDNKLNWKWKGVLHEAVDAPGRKTSGLIAGVENVVRTDGARSKDPEKYQKDAKLLEDALVAEPNNKRYVFYLAQSYRDAEDNKKALETYGKRAKMGGWDEEVFFSLFQMAILKERLKYPEDEIIAAYYDAFTFRPTRAEPLNYLAEFYRKDDRFGEGYVAAKAGLAIPQPKDLLFVEQWSYDYGLLLECSVCAYWLGKYQECHDQTLKILAVKDLPQNVKECAERNLAFAKEKLK